MFADMARHHAAVGIESAAGRGADEHHDGFASKELLGAAGTTTIKSNAAEKMTFAARQIAKLIERPLSFRSELVQLSTEVYLRAR